MQNEGWDYSYMREMILTGIGIRIKRCIFRMVDGTYSPEDLEIARVICKHLELRDRASVRAFCSRYDISIHKLREFISIVKAIDKTTLSQEQLPVDISEDELLLLIGGDSFG